MEKIVRCEKCGAMVKVLIECTCNDCGIKCCNDDFLIYLLLTHLSRK